ncbi:MAG: outer membrane protein assembly factor BamA [Halobacteriovoraceae bacterium]|nr:outer membrane protein assembly factor BamA [Halobacteriovoraceae bacterium]MCB9095482.1 outer membrane protein assembly factor BamA [Halobacteriovoraceae bacterium]
MKRILLVVVSLYFCLSANAELVEDIGPRKNLFKIDKIEIKGLRKIEPQAVLEKISAAPGKWVTTYSLRSDLKKIHQMKYFEELEADHEVRGGKNILIFKIKEKPIVKKIFVEGNDEIDDDEIKEQISTKEFNIVDINSLKQDINTISKMYEDKGYFLADINYNLQKDSNEAVAITFNIEEHDKVKVKKITFLGNKEIPDDELKNFMLTREDSTMSGMSEAGSFKEFNFQADIERLSYYYRTKGYLQVNVGSPVITVSEDKRWIFITLNITEGPQYEVKDINFSGDLLYTEAELLEKVSLKSSETYSEEKLRKDIQNLTELYQDLGYAFVNVLRTLDPIQEDGKHKVNVNFSFEKGKIAYFGKINIRGNTKTRDKVVRRELKIFEGMKFSGSKLRISKENVNRLGFFEQGSVVFNTVSRKNRDNVLDVNISVKERQTGQISVGAGYSTDTKGFLRASIKQNNFRGLGQNLTFSLDISDLRQTYSLGFTEPYFMDTKWTVGGLYYRTTNTFIEAYDFDKEGMDLRIGYPVWDYTRVFLTYNIEDTQISDVKVPNVNPDEENGIASGVEVSLVHDKRDNAFEPSDGYYLSTGIEYVGLGFDHKWLKGSLEGRYYYPIYGDFVFRSRIRSLQLFKVDNQVIPRSEKFAMGGSRNMRGYGNQKVGPMRTLTDVDGNPGLYNVGGLHSLLGTIEIEHPLVKEAGLKWAVFYDVGNVYLNYFGEESDYSLRQDFGFGFRWFSPIGVLRFEFGYPIHRTENDSPNMFFFDIGQIF